MQSATGPMPNCLDFGWRSRRLQKSGSLARTCGNGDYPAPQVVKSFIAAAKS
jgi:hypothetical protein